MRLCFDGIGGASLRTFSATDTIFRYFILNHFLTLSGGA